MKPLTERERGLTKSLGKTRTEWESEVGGGEGSEIGIERSEGGESVGWEWFGGKRRRHWKRNGRIRLIEEQKHSQYLSSSVVELRLEREKGKRLVGGNECKLCTIWLPPTTYHHSL